MSALSNAKWTGLRLSFATYSFGGAGRGAGGGAGATTGGGAGAAGAGAGAGGGAAAGGASRTVATGRLAQAATKRRPMIIVARIERSMNVRTVSPPLLFCYPTSVLIHLYGPTSVLNGTLVG